MILDHVITARERCWELCQQLTTLDQKLLLMEINAALNFIAQEAASRPRLVADARDRQTRAAADNTLTDS